MSDQSENLDDLAREAALIESTPSKADEARAQHEAQQEQATQNGNVGELLAAATMIRALWLPLLPPHKAAVLASVWSDQTLANGAQAGAQVLALHGVQLGEVLGRYGPYVALVAALGPPVLATVQVMRTPEPQPATETVVRTDEGAASGQAG